MLFYYFDISYLISEVNILQHVYIRKVHWLISKLTKTEPNKDCVVQGANAARCYNNTTVQQHNKHWCSCVMSDGTVKTQTILLINTPFQICIWIFTIIKIHHPMLCSQAWSPSPNPPPTPTASCYLCIVFGVYCTEH